MVNIRPFQSRPLAERIGSGSSVHQTQLQAKTPDPSQRRPQGPVLSPGGHTECPSPPSRDVGPPIRRGSLDGPIPCGAQGKHVGLWHLLTALPGPLQPSSPAPTAAIAAPASQVAEALSGPSGEEGLRQRGGAGGGIRPPAESLFPGPATLPCQLRPSLPASSSPAV